MSTPAPGPYCAVPTPRVLPVAEGEEGLQIVLTPIQLAAVLEGADFDPQPSTSDRLWGAATLVGGALELIGAGALLLTPEPTLVTKGAGVVLGAHGLDTAAAGARQVWSGRPEQTYTSAGVQATAEALSVDPITARRIGMAVDIAVPLVAGGIGALRALAVRRGVISLAAEEAAGGHTILKHVARTERELLARFATEPRLPASTSFSSLRQAEQAVSEVLRLSRQTIRQWAASSGSGSGAAPTLRLTLNIGRDVGYGIVRGSTTVQRATVVRVVLKRVVAEGRTHFVLTSFPLL